MDEAYPQLKGKPEHRIIAERVLGKPLSPGVEVHHYDGRQNNRALVICENRAYHKLIEARQRAYDACGHADWIPCRLCKEYAPPTSLRRGFHGYHHEPRYSCVET